MEQLEMFQRVRETIETVLTRLEDKRFGHLKKLPENYHIIQELEAKVEQLLREKDRLTAALDRHRRRELLERSNAQKDEEPYADDASDIIQPVSEHRWSIEDNIDYYPSSSVRRPQQSQVVDQPSSSHHPDGDVLMPVYDMLRGDLVPNTPQPVNDPGDIMLPVYDVTKSSRPLPALETYLRSSDPYSNDAMAAQIENEQTMQKKSVPTNYGRPLPQLIVPDEQNCAAQRIENSTNNPYELVSRHCHLSITCAVDCQRLFENIVLVTHLLNFL